MPSFIVKLRVKYAIWKIRRAVKKSTLYATADVLDSWGHILGIFRLMGETDESMRKRIRATLLEVLP